MISFRKFDYSDTDYNIYHDIQVAVWGEYGLPKVKFRHENKTRRSTHDFQYFVGELDGMPVAFGEFGEGYWNTTPHEYHVMLLVKPNYRRQGIEKAYEAYVSAEITPSRTIRRLVTGTRTDEPQAVALLERRGFTVGERYTASVLQLDDFEPAKFADKVQKVSDSSVVLQSLAQWQQTELRWQEKWEEMEYILEQDEPHPDEPTRMLLDEFVAMRFSGPDYTPEMWFAATDGDQLVGISMLAPHALSDDMYNTHWTGIARNYRRTGLATALKVKALNAAKQMGIKRVFTGNNAANPMYTLNLALGFEPVWTWVEYVKEI